MYGDPYGQDDMDRLRTLLEIAADEVASVQAMLYEVTGDFSRVAQEVIGVVGGSAQRVDQEMVASFEEAKARTNAALDALAIVQSSLRRLD